MGSDQGLLEVQALVFDVFGTVVEWESPVAVRLLTYGALNEEESRAFARQWRDGYEERTHAIAIGTREGSLSVDVMHREILEDLLGMPRWTKLVELLDNEGRAELTTIWHYLNGWPDSSEGLHELKKQFIIASLSNGNVKLQVDMAKHANLPWDMIFAAELLGSFKPNPKMYLGAANLLNLPTNKVAMVAAHIADLRAAGSHGLRTIYVRRPTEDTDEEKKSVKSKAEGGEVDVVVNSFLELAQILSERSD